MKQVEDGRKKPSLMNSQSPAGCLFRGFIFVVLPIIIILFICSLCTRGCGSDYYERWDYLDHSVKSDQYYKNWENP